MIGGKICNQIQIYGFANQDLELWAFTFPNQVISFNILVLAFLYENKMKLIYAFRLLNKERLINHQMLTNQMAKRKQRLPMVRPSRIIDSVLLFLPAQR